MLPGITPFTNLKTMTDIAYREFLDRAGFFIQFPTTREPDEKRYKQ